MGKKSIPLTAAQTVKNLLENKTCKTCTFCQWDFKNLTNGHSTPKGCSFNTPWHLGDSEHRYLKPLKPTGTCSKWEKGWRFNDV
jgi:hypothetical protein